MARVLAMVLAGGQGERLSILSQERAKPAMPFAGKYRIIDFTLSNCVNSGVYNVAVLAQYRPRSLDHHIGIGKPWDLDRRDGGIHLLQPYLGRDGSHWYRGTADAVYQNLYWMEEQRADLALVLGGDLIYKLDYNHMIDFHEDAGADLTIMVSQVPPEEAHRFGIITIDGQGRVIDFVEKPKKPEGNLVSTGIYLFTKEALAQRLAEDAEDPGSSHDFGKDVLPRMIRQDKVYALGFNGYWRDVGTVHSYWEANMDLLEQPPLLDLRDNWVVHTKSEERAPAFIGDSAQVVRSLISHGCVIEGRVEHSVLSPGVKVGRGAMVKDSVIMFDTAIGRDSLVDFSILDKEVEVGEGCRIGFGANSAPNDQEPDILNTGITLVGKRARIPDGTQIGRNCKVNPGVTPRDFPGPIIESGRTVEPRREHA